MEMTSSVYLPAGPPPWTEPLFLSFMQHFADMDSDGDGFVTAEDLYLFAATLGHNLSFKQVWDLLDDKDNDSDGGLGPCFVAMILVMGCAPRIYKRTGVCRQTLAFRAANISMCV